MEELSIDTIKSAQAKDLDAIGAVVRGMENRIAQLATKAAASSDQRDEFMQIGRIAVWEAVDRFTGDSMDSFYAFMHRTIDTTLRDAVRTEHNAGATGADHDALKIFTLMMREAKGDPELAEELCLTLPKKGRRLSRDRAHAARLAWVGTVSLDAGQTGGGDDDATMADLLESDYGVPEDLVAPSDIAKDVSERKGKVVRAVIETMGAKQAEVLRSRYGIEPSPCLGTGTEADAELADKLNTKPATVRVLRNQAFKSFAARYSRVTGLTPCMCESCEKHRRAEGVSL